MTVGVARRREQRRDHVFVRAHVVDDRAGLDDAGPADQAGDAVAALPLRVLLAAEHRRAAVGPVEELRAVVAGIHDDGVVLDAQFLELGEQLADMAVVLDHAVGIDAETGLAFAFLLQMREDVHAGGVPPDEERLVGLLGAFHELERTGGDFLVHRLHALLGQRAGVLDRLLADLAEARVIGRIVLVRREAVQDAARAELRLEGRVLRIVHVLRLLFRIQVVEVAEPFIEPVNRGQHVVAVAEVVLAELAGRVTERLEQLGERRVGLR